MISPRSIRQLDESVVSKIAAGEAISCPSNAIKELLENSIDARASRIVVEIENGGYNLIRIVDDGCGINYCDIPLACKVHTTSKISQYSDLYNIQTFGFRGEALHSISMVTYLKIMTKTQNDELGSVANFENGEIVGKIDRIALTRGTTIEARNLFYSYPMRLKGIKPISESKKITDIISKYSVIYPDISFTVRCDRKETMITYGSPSNSEDVLKLLYDVDNINFFHCNFELDGNVYVDLIMSEPNTKVKKKTNAIFINGRLVKNDNLTKGIEEAYTSHGTFGNIQFSFITMKMPPQNIDVNIHPKKEKVSFLNEKIILSEICERVKMIIDEHLQIQKTKNSLQKSFSAKKLSNPPIDLKNQTKLFDFTTKSQEDSNINLNTDVSDQINQENPVQLVPTKSITKAIDPLLNKVIESSDDDSISTNHLLNMIRKPQNINSNQTNENKNESEVPKNEIKENLKLVENIEKVEPVIKINSTQLNGIKLISSQLPNKIESKQITKSSNQPQIQELKIDSNQLDEVENDTNRFNQNTIDSNQLNEDIQSTKISNESKIDAHKSNQEKVNLNHKSLPKKKLNEDLNQNKIDLNLNNTNLFNDHKLDTNQFKENSQAIELTPSNNQSKLNQDEIDLNEEIQLTKDETKQKQNKFVQSMQSDTNQNSEKVSISLHDFINEKDASLLIDDSPTIKPNSLMNNKSSNGNLLKEPKLTKKKLFSDLKYEPNIGRKSSIKKKDVENTPKLEDLFSQIGDTMKRKFRVVKLNSIINFRKQREEEADIELTALFHSDKFEFVGFIGTKSIVFNGPPLNPLENSDEDDDLPFKIKKEVRFVYIFNLFALMKDLLKHKFLELFSNMPTFNVEIQLNEVMNPNSSVNHFFNDSENCQSVKTLLEEKGMMLLEYFSILYKNDLIKAMPDVIRGYRPSFIGFPLFLEKLSTNVDWEEEMSCFDGIIDQLSSLYSILPIDERNQKMANNLKLQFKSAVLPELHEDGYKPNISLRTEKSFVVIPMSVK